MLLPNDWLDRDLREIATLAPFQKVSSPLLEERAVCLWVKREDLLHPLVGGNKIYKLYGYLNDYRRRGLSAPIATFGGAYSNHILALAAAGNALGVKTQGIIRGERPARLSPTLTDAMALGMDLHFVSRSAYRRRGETSFLAELNQQLGGCYWVPEGGSGYLGAFGGVSLAAGVLDVFDGSVDALFHACGTGSTFAGMAAGLAMEKAHDVHAYGVNVLKAGAGARASIRDQIRQFDIEEPQWTLLEQYHFGGYAKYPSELADFVQEFEATNRFCLDPVYTSKVIMAIFDLVNNRFFAPGTTVVAIHSGGLQGRRGFGLDSNTECVNR